MSRSYESVVAAVRSSTRDCRRGAASAHMTGSEAIGAHLSNLLEDAGLSPAELDQVARFATATAEALRRRAVTTI